MKIHWWRVAVSVVVIVGSALLTPDETPLWAQLGTGLLIGVACGLWVREGERKEAKR